MRRRPADLTADAVVVGSGAGGGVAAANLARAGLDVVLIEEGPHVPSSEFTQREGEMYSLLFRDRMLQATADASVVVLQGRCVGGSTVVNMADITDVPRELLDFWRDGFRIEDLPQPELAAAARRVRKAIGAGPIEAREVNRNNELLLQGADKLGYRGGLFEDNRVGCVGSGYCQLGCAYDAKRSVLVTYVPEAVAHGATLMDRTRVERIRHSRGEVEGIDATKLDADGRPAGELRIDAPTVFLCAGSIHTPLILNRSKLGGRQVGRNLSLQPQAPIVARFPERLRSFRGIPQASFVDEFEQVSADSGFGGFRIEGIFGPPATASAFLPGVGASMLELLGRYDQLAAALVLVPDHPEGRVQPFGRELIPRIAYTPKAAYLERVKEGLLTAAEIYFAAGAEAVYLPQEGLGPLTGPDDLKRARAKLTLRPIQLRLISAHPQGTARMSDDRRWGVVDSHCRVHGASGLYVTDGSIFPTTASSHTMLPIMAFADVASRRFLAGMGARLDG